MPEPAIQAASLPDGLILSAQQSLAVDPPTGTREILVTGGRASGKTVVTRRFLEPAGKRRLLVARSWITKREFSGSLFNVICAERLPEVYDMKFDRIVVEFPVPCQRTWEDNFNRLCYMLRFSKGQIMATGIPSEIPQWLRDRFTGSHPDRLHVHLGGMRPEHIKAAMRHSEAVRKQFLEGSWDGEASDSGTTVA